MSKISKIPNEPLPSGFMKGGYFKWPVNDFICLDCKTFFKSETKNVLRCEKCRSRHKKEYHKKYDKGRDR